MTEVASRTLLRSVLERDDYTCQRCGHKGAWGIRQENVQVHHVLPRAFGGDHQTQNLVTLCDPCHRKTDAELHRAMRVDPVGPLPPHGMDDMTVQQVADALGYSPGYVRKLVQRSKLTPSVHYAGQLLRFSPVEVARYAKERRLRGRPRKPEQEATDG